MARIRRGQIPLWGAVALAIVGVIVLAWWTVQQTSTKTSDGRQEIVFWGHSSLGEDIPTLVHVFEDENPQYKVTLSTAAARDLVGDAQRLLCATAGGVPPDVVFFDRFAIGEWASRGALTDLTPYVDAQKKDDPLRIKLDEYYPWAMQEASYAPPNSGQKPAVFGIPLTADVRLMFIAKDAFRQAGLVDAKGEVTPPKNWDEMLADAKKLTVFRSPGDPRSGILRMGFAPNSGDSWLYMYAWQAGGEMMNPQRTKVTMNSAPVVRALKFMTECYDAVGGVGLADAFKDAQQSGAQNPFLTGQLAMKIDTDSGMLDIADWNPDLDFLCQPAPLPADRVAAGAPPVAWSGGYALVIPTTARQKDAAFKFIQFMVSDRGRRILEQGRREQREADGRLYLPNGNANRVQYEKLLQEAVFDNPNIPPNFKQAYSVVRDLMPHTHIRPVTPIGQLLWTQHVRATDLGDHHTFRDEARKTGRDEAEIALTTMQRVAQEQLDQLLNPKQGEEVHWKPYFITYALLLALPLAAIWVTYKRRRHEYGYRGSEVRAAMLFASPWMIGFAVFVGGPIIFSIVLSFTKYDVLNAAHYVGTDNYRDVVRDPIFYKSLWNTAYMLINVPLGMAVSLAIALLLNRAVRGLGLYRAAFYLPAIIPLVAASLMWFWLFNPNYGLLNSMLAWLYETRAAHWIEATISRLTGGDFKFIMPLWLKDPYLSKPSIIIMKLWGAGSGMIIWLAGLQSISQELYEAAAIDGANKWKQFWNVTIPMLSPYILFNLIIGVIGTMQIFTEAYIMTEGLPADSTLFYAYYLFKQAFQFFRMGFASAMAWILFVLVLALTLLQLWLSKKWVHYEQA